MKKLERSYKGCQLYMKWTCHSEHSGQWKSSGDLQNMAEINLVASAAILYSGTTYYNIADFFRLLDATFLSATTYYSNQANHLIPTISKYYFQQQQLLLQKLSGRESVVLMGDGRYDKLIMCIHCMIFYMMQRRILQLALKSCHCIMVVYNCTYNVRYALKAV